MAVIPTWQPGFFYPPGSLVQPATAVPISLGALTNPGFELGSADWTFGPGTVHTSSTHYDGVSAALMTGNAGSSYVVHDEVAFPYPGATVAARAFYQQGAANAGNNRGCIILRWFDAGMSLLREDRGSMVTSGSAGDWAASTISAQAPAGTAFVAVGGLSLRTHNPASAFDAFSWSVANAPTSGLVYRAVQPAPGTSDVSEPAWPGTPGVQVIDNTVTWEALFGSRLVWRAFPIMKSGPTEPDWPTSVGGEVLDNTISWKVDSRAILHPKCPKSKIVVIDQGKAYVADGDIVAFCAVNNPFDWGTPNDAGYLPFGLGQYGANPIRAMGKYRQNLIPFNSDGFQLWQIDPNPALNQRLDELPVGSTFHRALARVANDLLFLSALGVRSIGVAAASTNIRAGDVGAPIDPMVQAKLALGEVPLGLYIPSAGQYWLVFRYAETSEAFVYTLGQIGSQGSWSRYVLPYRVDHAALDGNVLVLRAGNRIIEVLEQYDRDLIDSPSPLEIVSDIEWPFLECGGQIGQDKELEGFDLVSSVANPAFPPEVKFGWDQRNRALETPAVVVPSDTVPDYLVPVFLTAPSISPRIRYTGRKWQFSAMNLYLLDRRAAR